MLSSGASELDYFKSTPEGMLEAMIVTGNEDAETIMVGSNTRNPGDLVEMKSVTCPLRSDNANNATDSLVLARPFSPSTWDTLVPDTTSTRTMADG